MDIQEDHLIEDSYYEEHDSDTSDVNGELQEHVDGLSSSAFVNSCRCATHTLKLAVLDVIKTKRSQVQEIRDFVKRLKKNPHRHAFDANKLKKAFLDVPTRWNSTYDMINCFVSQKQFIVDMVSKDSTFNITEDLWLFMEKFEKAFVATKM